MIGKDKINKYKDFLIKVTMFIVFNIFTITGENVKESEIIYILEWTPTDAEPFTFLEKKQSAFVNRKCAFQNCYLTSNHSYFTDIFDFDVLIFNAAHMNSNKTNVFPDRSLSQKYIMVAMEPAGFYPLPAQFDDFFNFTWTYKLDSDVPFPYIIVKNRVGEVIGPKIDMHWMKIQDMDASSVYVNKTKNKRIAAAWFASNCISYQRLHFVRKLNDELSKYGERVDIYGKCGNHQCSKKAMLDECYNKIQSDYYFYLAFENSIGVDYVSEKLLHALQNFAVPIVLGGANYSRFMPEGIYLDALSLGPEQLAKTMVEIIADIDKYHKFFNWHGYYTFHLTSEDSYNREVCGLCELLNNEVHMNKTTIVRNLSGWWNEENPFPHSTNVPWSDGCEGWVEERSLKSDDYDDSESEIVSSMYNFVFGS